MKTILVLSDTHGNISALEKLVPIMKDSDYIFHLGDFERDIKLFKEFDNKIVSVKGNCDGGGKDQIIEIENNKILLTHGDKYGVKQSLLRLTLKATELGANLVFYGHTHLPKIEEYNGITFINPGSATAFSNRSYCYTVICKDKIVSKIVNF